MRDKIIKLLVKNALKLDNAGWGGRGWKEDYAEVADEILALFANSEQERQSTFRKIERDVRKKYAGEPIYSRDEYLKAARILSVRKPCYCEKCVGENNTSFEEDEPNAKPARPDLYESHKPICSRCKQVVKFEGETCPALLWQLTGDEVI